MSKDAFLTTIIIRDKIYHIKTTRPKTFMKNCQNLIIEMKDEMLKEEEEKKSPQLTFESF